LEIEREVDTFAQEGNSRRIGIDTVDTDGTVTGHISVECDILIGVCK
jgi:hypothetical protein